MTGTIPAPSYPYAPRVIPTALGPMDNGKLTACQLAPVYFPGVGHLSLYPVAARAWNALAVVCHAETGQTLSATGTYRTYQQQLTLFLTRYTLGPFDPARHRVDSTGEPMTRTWQGHTYYLLRGYSPAAVPGTSNHGLGIAVDAAWFAPPKQPTTPTPIVGTPLKGITSVPDGWAWIVRNAGSFGWGWEGAAPGRSGYEPWHLRHTRGDTVTQRVIDVERFLTAAAQ